MCEIAQSFWAEYREATGVDSDDDSLASAAVLKAMSRASNTRHENQTEALYVQQGLSAPIPISKVDLPGLPGHPYFKVSDYLRVFTEQDKLHLLMGGEESCFDKIATFWQRYHAVCPEHPIYKKSESCRRFQIPILLYADEGQTLKKQSIMVIAFQPALGAGSLSSQHHRSNEDGMGLNFAGSSYRTRFLLSCMLKNKYRKSAETFDDLIRVFVSEFNLMFEEGVGVSLASGNQKLGLTVIGVKGDWPILTRMGYLGRHFGRLAFGGDRPGICHLCMAGTEGIPYHEYDEHAKWIPTYLQSSPFSRDDGPLSQLHQSPAQERTLLYDIFHVCHKGVFAELSGSAIAPWMIFRKHLLSKQKLIKIRVFFRFLNAYRLPSWMRSWLVAAMHTNALTGCMIDCTSFAKRMLSAFIPASLPEHCCTTRTKKNTLVGSSIET